MTNNTTTSTCCDFDPNAITIEQAQTVILEQIQSIKETEVVGTREALGRVLRQDVISTLNNPPSDNSAMDGYGVLAEDIQTLPCTLQVIGKSFAGKPFNGTIKSGQAVRIMTGAMIPAGVDTVVMQEQTEGSEDNAQVVILNSVTKGQNIRRQGEDIEVGQTVLRAGTVLTAGCIGILATMGVTEIEVTRKINVAVLATGDELQSVGSVLKEGNIYDSNRYALLALLADPRFNLIEKGVLADEKAIVRQGFIDIANYADAVITTGGVSVGEADWIKECVRETGELVFWKAAIKPGRPITFGKVGKAVFFGLPGNPVAVMVTFMKFAALGLQKLSGQVIQQPVRLQAKTLSRMRKRAGRTEFQRGILSYDNSQQPVVKSTGGQGSGILSSMADANCLIILESDDTGAEIGDTVFVEPFSHYI